MKLSDFTPELGKEIVGYSVLLGTLLGVARQYFSLVLIGEGTWILPYFSVSFSIIDGLSFLLYFYLVILGFIVMINYKNAMSKYHWQQRFFPTLFFIVLSGIISYILFSYNSYFTVFGIIFHIHFWKILFNQPKYHDEKILDIKYIFTLFVIVGFVIGLLDLYKIFSPDDQSNIKNAPILKEQFKDKIVTGLYVNDIYVFIQSEQGSHVTLSIQKIEALFNEEKNAIKIK